MSGPSVTSGQLSQLILDKNREIVLQRYAGRRIAWEQFSTRIPNLSVPTKGHRWIGGTVEAGLRRRAEGTLGEAINLGTGYARQLRVVTFERSYSVERQAIEAANGLDTYINDTNAITEQFTDNAANYGAEQFAGMLQYGRLAAGSTTYFDAGFDGFEDPYPGLIYDGKPLLAASGNAHPYKYATVSGGGINLVPSTSLSAANLDAGITRMSETNAFSEEGTKIQVRPTHLIHGSALRSTAYSLLNSELSPGDSTNAANAMRNAVQIADFTGYITNQTTAWWLISGNGAFAHYDTGAPEVRTWYNEEADSFFTTWRWRFGLTVKDWRYIIGFNMADS